MNGVRRSIATFDTKSKYHLSACDKHDYQAIFATKLFGYLLTRNFLPSSNNSNAIPNPMGMNQCATGTVAVPSVEWKFGTYRKKIAMRRAKMMAGMMYLEKETHSQHVR